VLTIQSHANIKKDLQARLQSPLFMFIWREDLHKLQLASKLLKESYVVAILRMEGSE